MIYLDMIYFMTYFAQLIFSIGLFNFEKMKTRIENLSNLGCLFL